MAAWKSHKAEQNRGQTRIITEALKEDSGNQEIAQLLSHAFVIITEVAYQLRFTFAHQLEHLQLPRDLRYTLKTNKQNHLKTLSEKLLHMQ